MHVDQELFLKQTLVLSEGGWLLGTSLMFCFKTEYWLSGIKFYNNSNLPYIALESEWEYQSNAKHKLK